MDIFTFSSFKGGTSKTSTSIHVGAGLAKFKKQKVLLIDFDSQANLSIGLGVGPDNVDTMVPVLKGEKAIKDVIRKTSISGFHIVPANAYLDGIERTPPLGSDPYAHERLRRALKSVEADYDFCFLDTPPSLSWLTQSAFYAAKYSVICAIPEAYSVLALRRLKEFQDQVRQNHDIDVFGVVLSFWDRRGAVNEEFLKQIEASFPDKLFMAKVRRDMTVSRAVLSGKTVFDFDNESNAAEDYRALADEFLARFTSGRSYD